MLIDTGVLYFCGMRFFTADRIYPITAAPIDLHVLVVSDKGVIEDLVPTDTIDPLKIETFEGALVPGFINAHCHLELSHLKDAFPEKTGLPGFISLITQHRAADPDFIQQAAIDADAEMWQNGIVAVGDISNNESSFSIKSRSKIHYHTFIELFAFNPDRAAQLLENGNALLAAARSHNIAASLAPHAPYSINEKLVRGILQQCAMTGMPTSIHMLESNDENELYVRSTGLFRKLYREMGILFDTFFTPTGKTSLESVLPWFDTQVKTLLVHNTIATAWDADWAEDVHPNLFWCFCPNANDFIEDRIPDVPMLMEKVQYIALGTDSLASNHQLSILSEMQRIRNKYPEIAVDNLLRWATLHGAKALNIEDTYGSFDRGKRPGVSVVRFTDAGDFSMVQRIV